MEEPTYYLDRPGQFLRPCVGLVPRVGDEVVIEGSRHTVAQVQLQLSDGHPGNSELEGIIVRVGVAL